MPLLAAWTAIGLLWWITAALLVASAPSRATSRTASGASAVRISIFKPIPSPLGDREFGIVSACLESFVANLDADSELLLGADEPERDRVTSFVAAMREKYPEARIELLVEPLADTRMHPKVAWNRKLSRLATGDVWLWSDADMRLPAGTLASLRADLDERTCVTPW